MRSLCVVLVVLGLAGCDDDSTPAADFASADLSVSGADLASGDLAMPDLSAPDLATPDLATPDLALPDLAMPDLKTCTPNAFIQCLATDAIYCNGTGDGTTPVACGAGGCIGGGSCGQCTPSSTSCAAGVETDCDQYGRATTRNCGLGCNGAIACVTCVAGTTSCNGAADMLMTCNADGISQTVTACSLGCLAGNGDPDAGTLEFSRCAALTPSNGLTLDCNNKTSTVDLIVNANTTIDPTAGTIGGVAPASGVFSTVVQASNGLTIGVFHLRTLTVNSGFKLTVTPGANALGLVVDGSVTINGTIDLAGHLDNAKAVATGGAGSQNVNGKGVNGGSSKLVGAGGAGHATSGADSGGPSPLGKAGGAYEAVASPETNVPLSGGAPGGSVGGSNTSQGGGALQLVACGTITVGAAGLANAGGSGAPQSAIAAPSGGPGGGSGGAILVEAPVVNVSGVLAAAGGGGAGNDAASDFACTLPGSTGGLAVGTGGLGGSGACGTNGPTTGGVGTLAAGGGGSGGGGGAGGRIRINTKNNVNATVGASSISPKTASNYTTGTLTLQ